VVETETKHLGRNEPCHCGSGKKYKHCCLAKDEEAAREKAQQATTSPPPPPAEPERTPHVPPRRREANQPWKRTTQSALRFKRAATPRKVGSG